MSALGGIWAAVLTPVDSDLAPDPSRAIPYYEALLEDGCDGLNVMGTTGEAMSFSVPQRARYIEALASSALPVSRMMAGTGAASLADAASLTGVAAQAGFAAALVMPPFFFRDVADDGMMDFFDGLLARTSLPSNGIVLYNFPAMSGVTFHPGLVDRLIAAFPQQITGMKDSSNDAALQAELVRRHPDFAVFTGSESGLLGATSRGAAGCISGSVALWPQLAARVVGERDDSAARELDRRRAALGGLALTPAVRYLVSKSLRQPEWDRAMPPRRPLTVEQRRALDAALQR